MNDELLIIIPLNKINENKIEDALNKLNAFSNVLILNYSNNTNLINKLASFYHILNEIGDPLQIIKYCQDNYKNIKAITYIKNLYETDIEDVIKVSKEAIDNKNSFIIGITDNSLINSKVTNFLYKVFFNYNIHDAFSPLYSLSLDLANKITNINAAYSDNILITLIENNIDIKEINIKTIYNKNNTFNTLKINYNALFKYFLKLFIPYILSLLVFFILFYFIDNVNDLTSLIITTLISGFIGVIINFLMNYPNIYRHNNFGNNFIYIFKKVLKILISGFLIYILYNLLNINLLLSKLIIDILLTIIFYLIFKNVGFKDEKKN